MGKLVLFVDGEPAREIRLDRERITIGRRPDNDVCLPKPAVSGEHAAVVTILADSFLEDLGSTNGTHVNGNPVTKHFLRDRDQIDIGRQIMIYLADDTATLTALPQWLERSEGEAARDDGEGADARAAAAAHVVPGPPRANRRSDVGPPPPRRPADALESFIAAEIARDAPDETAPPTGTEVPPGAAAAGPLSGPAPAIKVLSGTNAGHLVALTNAETLVGRAGVQVAALRRTADEIRVVPVEGGQLPAVNGVPIAPDGQRLAAGDVLEIAGTTLELIVPPKADT